MNNIPRRIGHRATQTCLAGFIIFMVCVHVLGQTAEVNTNTAWLPLAELLKKWENVPWEQVQGEANKGNPLAQHYLGYCYMEGLRTTSNPETGAFWYRRALTNGYLPSANNLGLAYQRGLLGSNDMDKAIYYYTYAAERGFAQSEVNLGILYRDGIGVQRDSTNALHWFRLAAAKGHPVAMVEIGRAYRFGSGLEQNLAEAEKWFQKSVDLGNGTGQLNLGLLYEEEGRRAEAFQLYQRVADQGETDAMLEVYRCYWDGIGVAPDHARAMQWLTKAANAGSPAAQCEMGYRCETPDTQGGSDAKPVLKLAEACQWYRRASDQNYVGGQYHLGLYYLEGLVVEQDEERGLELVRAAADQGLSDALSELANLYARGIGEPRSAQENPMHLYERAHDYTHLILRYRYGVGTDRDMIAVARCYVALSIKGTWYWSPDKLVNEIQFKPSKQIGGMHSELDGFYWPADGDAPDPPDEDMRFLSLYLKSSLGDGQSSLEIANCYLVGKDAPKSMPDAWCWLTIAAQNGSDKAIVQLHRLESQMNSETVDQARRKLPSLLQELKRVGVLLRTNGGEL